MLVRLLSLLLIATALSTLSPLLPALSAQTPPAKAAADTTSDATDNSTSDSNDEVKVADKVEVDPINSDQEISERLQSIFEATTWFDGIQVRVEGGVAFLTGVSDTEKHRDWAEQTAMNTTDVVAVVNRLTIQEKPIWNIAPAVASLKDLAREATSMLPLIVVALAIVVLFYFLAVSGARLVRWLGKNRIDSVLLRQVSGNVVGVVIFIIGFYIALRVSGLTRLAVTLLGGTGLVGLALGFAFRDIAENYLASVLISLNNPFRVGDLVEISGQKGYVRKVTTRGTILATEDGNQVQIPNSAVYKGTILNHTATPLTRREFIIGIGRNDPIAEAQSIIMDTLNQHTAVVDEPAPLALVDSLSSATVQLRCQFWIDQEKHSAGKVASSLIRQVTQKLAQAGISIPDQTRELVFPQGVPVTLVRADQAAEQAASQLGKHRAAQGDDASLETKTSMEHASESETSAAEGDLTSERAEIERATKDEGAIQDDANLLQAN